MSWSSSPLLRSRSADGPKTFFRLLFLCVRKCSQLFSVWKRGWKSTAWKRKKYFHGKGIHSVLFFPLFPVGKFVSRMTKEGFNFGEIELDLPPIFWVRGECKKGSPQFPRRKAEDGKLSPSPYLLRKKWWLCVDALADSCDSLVFSLAKNCPTWFSPTYVYIFCPQLLLLLYFLVKRENWPTPLLAQPDTKVALLRVRFNRRKLGSVDISV